MANIKIKIKLTKENKFSLPTALWEHLSSKEKKKDSFNLVGMNKSYFLLETPENMDDANTLEQWLKMFKKTNDADWYVLPNQDPKKRAFAIKQKYTRAA
jgi:hypothetical protein